MASCHGWVCRVAGCCSRVGKSRVGLGGRLPRASFGGESKENRASSVARATGPGTPAARRHAPGQLHWRQARQSRGTPARCAGAGRRGRTGALPAGTLASQVQLGGGQVVGGGVTCRPRPPRVMPGGAALHAACVNRRSRSGRHHYLYSLVPVSLSMYLSSADPMK